MYRSAAKEDSSSTALTILYTTLLIIVAVLADGFLIKTFWTWFVLSVFPDLPILTIVQAIGLSLSVTFLKTSKEADKADSLSNALLKATIYIVVRVALYMLFGWIITLFM